MSKVTDPYTLSIVQFVESQYPKAARSDRVAAALGYDRQKVSKTLARLHERGLLDRPSKGWYRKKIEEEPKPSLIENFLSRPAGASIL